MERLNNFVFDRGSAVATRNPEAETGAFTLVWQQHREGRLLERTLFDLDLATSVRDEDFLLFNGEWIQPRRVPFAGRVNLARIRGPARGQGLDERLRLDRRGDIAVLGSDHQLRIRDRLLAYLPIRAIRIRGCASTKPHHSCRREKQRSLA